MDALFALALLACICGLVLAPVTRALRSDLGELDSTIEKLSPPARGRKVGERVGNP